MTDASAFTKYGFRIRTRDGGLVDNLAIAGRDEAEAVRKLRQMYRDCEILECAPVQTERHAAGITFDDVAKLINR
ncbi:MAG TPA: hypothetical protein VMC81_10980 [Rhodocyclaceae bacterium]|nr:hypothetical protein [Rhodocyclaceae bacterium]